MAEARRRSQWEHTALIACQFAEAHRDRKRKPTPFKFEDFYPFKVRKPPDVPKVDISALKVFVKR